MELKEKVYNFMKKNPRVVRAAMINMAREMKEIRDEFSKDERIKNYKFDEDELNYDDEYTEA